MNMEDNKKIDINKCEEIAIKLVKHLNNNNLNIFELQFILIMLKDSIDSYKKKN